jgi:hypothetical protein
MSIFRCPPSLTLGKHIFFSCWLDRGRKCVIYDMAMAWHGKEQARKLGTVVCIGLSMGWGLKMGCRRMRVHIAGIAL